CPERQYLNLPYFCRHVRFFLLSAFSFHSWNRWAILIFLCGAIGNASYTNNTLLEYSFLDQFISYVVLLVIYIQGIVGLILYWNSALSQNFIQNPIEGKSLR
ncbi:MAG: hypothetical protein ACI9GM_001448, partial [Salibacteraceae bacterium]